MSRAEQYFVTRPEKIRSVSRRVAVLALCIVATWSALPAHAQSTVAEVRRVYADVQKRLPKLSSTKFVGSRPGVTYRAEGRAWSDTSGIVKIEVIERDDSGDVVSEFFYSNGLLVFVFESVKGFVENSNKQVTRSEERYYYQNGKLVEWISGISKEQLKNKPGSVEFNEVATSRLGASNAFLAAARKSAAGKK
jgi:hypothetical protein